LLWAKMFIEVMVRLHIKDIQRNQMLKSCCLRKVDIDDYQKNLKRERKRNRKMDRLKVKKENAFK